MPTYLFDAQEGTPLREIYRAWNGGLDKEEVTVRLIRRFGERHDDLLDETWGKLEAEFGDGCMPIVRPADGLTRVEKLKREWADESTSSMRRNHIEQYLSWKGEIGMGAQLRHIISENRA